MFDSNIPFTQEEIDLIVNAGLTEDEVKAFYAEYPDQSLDTAIGGCLDRKRMERDGEIPAGVEVEV
jgi:hypothetical protein